jgi:hypothetical protein
MGEVHPVEAIDEALLAGSYKRVLPVPKGEVAGGAECVFAGGEDCVLADGVEGDAPDHLVGGGMITLGM